MVRSGLNTHLSAIECSPVSRKNVVHNRISSAPQIDPVVAVVNDSVFFDDDLRRLRGRRTGVESDALRSVVLDHTVSDEVPTPSSSVPIDSMIQVDASHTVVMDIGAYHFDVVPIVLIQPSVVVPIANLNMIERHIMRVHHVDKVEI